MVAGRLVHRGIGDSFRPFGVWSRRSNVLEIGCAQDIGFCLLGNRSVGHRGDRLVCGVPNRHSRQPWKKRGVNHGVCNRLAFYPT